MRGSLVVKTMVRVRKTSDGVREFKFGTLCTEHDLTQLQAQARFNEIRELNTDLSLMPSHFQARWIPQPVDL